MTAAVLALAASVAPIATWAQEVTIETARGPVTLEANPESVAVYDMAAMDTLDALGVVPTGRIDNLRLKRLEHLDSATPVGTIFEPDLEKLAGLNPDLTIVGGRSAPKLQDVAQLSNAIDMTIGEDIIGDSRKRLAAYGTIFGLENKAAQMDAALQAKLDKVQAEAKNQGTALVVLTNGPKISAYGVGSRFGWIHNAVGLPQAAQGLAVDPHGNAISFEFIAEHNPDWLFVIDRGAAIGAEGESAKDTLDNPLVAQTNAAKNGHILYLNAADAYIAGGGYQAMMEMLDQVDAAFGADS
ncbi:iron ABC transporter substrate-binding protein [Thioclava sp. SK-1]|nr:iron ABC transporter substrate-binding protein [Thioclava sp. SK-1]